MELKDVVAIAGAPGLYKVVGQRKNGLIVEEISNRGRKMATSATQRISVLSDVEIYTEEDAVKLSDVLLEIKSQKEKGLSIPDKKAGNSELADFMKAVVPNYDREKVYVSDIKKLIAWWEALENTLDFEKLTEKEEEGESEESKKSAGDKATKSTAKRTVNKKAAPKTNTKSKGAKTISTPRKSS